MSTALYLVYPVVVQSLVPLGWKGTCIFLHLALNFNKAKKWPTLLTLYTTTFSLFTVLTLETTVVASHAVLLIEEEAHQCQKQLAVSVLTIWLCDTKLKRLCPLAIKITGNGPYNVRETTKIRCSVPINVTSIQWMNLSGTTSEGNVERANTRELLLNIVITMLSNNTRYRCTVRDDRGFVESENITITVGGTKL